MAVAAAPAACGDGLAKAAPPRQPGPRGRSAAPTAEVRSRLQLDGYGRVPHFLEEIVGVLEDELAYVEGLASGDSEEDLADRPQVRLLTDAERSCLLEGLDAKRSHLMRCFEEDLDLHPEEVFARGDHPHRGGDSAFESSTAQRFGNWTRTWRR
ncbi:unnamed protein product [Prorocentrum cordatum]|uniref:Uncharacterized protein n=1 Tax=Prorocentrum cordatum TaxID=2364126 RepID=A0ABN9Y4V8_9DINO|nr:unnamed protein product [Polarella glacialis]